MYTLDQRFRVRSLVEIARAEWKENKWQFTTVQEKSLTGEEHTQLQELKIQLQETPEDFSLIDMKAEEFSSDQLRQYIIGLQKKGLDTTEYLVDLHLKSAVPFATLVMTLIGIALTIPGSKQHTLPTALGLALIAGFSYWLVLALSISLGHSGALPPQLAAWLANGVAGLCGVFLLLGVD
jgi:lipopolysaccharide export system permease protein